MVKKTYLLFIFIVFPFVLHGQREDFRTWYNLQLEGELFNLIDFTITPELRLWDNSSRLESILGEVDLSSPLTKFFRLGGLYRYQVDYARKDINMHIHRLSLYGELDYRIERLRMAYRGMYQHEYINYNTSENGKIPETLHRHKVSFKYRRKGWDIIPVVAGEFFFTIKPERIDYEQKLRITAGFQYRLTKDININLHYKYQIEYFENNPLSAHIISTGIEYEL
ncbi:hypothetical protein ES705_35000 [subsurface metagenome]